MKHDQAEGLRRKLAVMDSSRKAEATIIYGGGKGFLNQFAAKICKSGKRVMLIKSDAAGEDSGTLSYIAKHQLSFREVESKQAEGFSVVESGWNADFLYGLSKEQQQHLAEQYNEMLHEYDCIFIDVAHEMPDSGLLEHLAAKNIVIVSNSDQEGMKMSYSMLKSRFSGSETDAASLLLIVEAAAEAPGRRALLGLRDLALKYLQVHIQPLGIILKHEKQKDLLEHEEGLKRIAGDFMAFQHR